jgi:hypothetical protein
MAAGRRHVPFLEDALRALVFLPAGVVTADTVDAASAFGFGLFCGACGLVGATAPCGFAAGAVEGAGADGLGAGGAAVSRGFRGRRDFT